MVANRFQSRKFTYRKMKLPKEVISMKMLMEPYIYMGEHLTPLTKKAKMFAAAHFSKSFRSVIENLGS